MKTFRIILLFLAFGMVIAPAQAETKQGLNVDVYTYDPSGLPEHEPKDYVLCKTITDTAWTSVANINHNFDSEYEGIVAGCQSDFVMIHYYGWITLPVNGTVTFQSLADDGFYLTIEDKPVIDEWTLKGCSGGTGTHEFQSGVPQRIDAWFYEYGGGACNQLFYATDDTAMQPIPDNAFSMTLPEPPTPIKVINSPTNLVAVVNKTTISLSWDVATTENVNVERYAVFWTYGDDVGWGMPITENKAVLADLPEDTDITISVRADNDTYGVYSQNSQSLIIRTGTLPIVPPIEPPVEPPVEPEIPVIVPPTEPVIPVEPEPTPEQPVTPDTAPKPIEKPVEPVLPVPDPVSVANLENIVPADLTEQQAEALMEEAYKIFLTAEVSSIEYEQALQALLIVAKADDIQLDPSIASIPLIGNIAGALIDSLNFIGNIGADMAPATRKKAEKVVISAVIVSQIALMSMPVPAPIAPPTSPNPTATLNRKN